MGSTPSRPTHTVPEAAIAKDPTQKSTEGMKPCCVCNETRKARDTCFFEQGDEAEAKCKYLVEAHMKCMRDLGFKV
ncbi:hypothetical protein EV182_005279 [Spiromyces aspiralis]|uniref:Uncharacterized protein n=1 Tax=Spiromyces aspiralis TaxID=68401 RepID=A0ACC1HN00_9FUNG|nr:hypothetical protein EV182_005279 [Spiromyces aspiralis]